MNQENFSFGFLSVLNCKLDETNNTIVGVHMQLREYQKLSKIQIYDNFNYYKNLLYVLPTGGGKTPIVSSIINEYGGYCLALAHRSELIMNLSVKLAQCGLKHRIAAPKNIIKWIIQMHIETTGDSFYSSSSRCLVASVDTLLSREDQLKHFLSRVGFWMVDEAHHLVLTNKWGRCISMVPNAVGLGVTATPTRSDGSGLGRHADGVFDIIIEGPTMRWLINNSYLSDYRIFAPPSDLKLDDVPIGKSGEFVQKKLIQQIRKSHIVGDVIEQYLKIAPGKLGMTFATDIETGADIAMRYKQAGVAAELVTSKTPQNIRMEVMRRFKRRQILQIVNVDLYGEGVDTPNLEVISMARPTESLGLYRQQFGRVVRYQEGKTALVIDHVNNVKRHNLPDSPMTWTLDRREKRRSKKRKEMPLRVCIECTGLYEAIYDRCPYCGHVHKPAVRSGPEQVEGDLIELDPKILESMRKEIARMKAPDSKVYNSLIHAGQGQVVAASAAKNHRERQTAQSCLRESMGWWLAHQRQFNLSQSEIYRKFYYTFGGVDVLTAQTLNEKKSYELAIKINKDIDKLINQ